MLHIISRAVWRNRKHQAPTNVLLYKMYSGYISPVDGGDGGGCGGGVCAICDGLCASMLKHRCGVCVSVATHVALPRKTSYASTKYAFYMAYTHWPPSHTTHTPAHTLTHMPLMSFVVVVVPIPLLCEYVYQVSYGARTLVRLCVICMMCPCGVYSVRSVHAHTRATNSARPDTHIHLYGATTVGCDRIIKHVICILLRLFVVTFRQSNRCV